MGRLGVSHRFRTRWRVYRTEFQICSRARSNDSADGGVICTHILVFSGAYLPDGNKWWFLFNIIVGLVAPIYFCVTLHRDEEGLLSE